MKLLAIDTSSSACSVALLINNEVHTLHEEDPRQQAKKILSHIHQVLSEAGITLNQLDAIAFGAGPGSFTGIRIATSVAQGLGFAMQLPLIPISSLAALAQATFIDYGWQKLLVAVDARIQEVYWGAYQVKNNLVELIGKEQVSLPSDLIFPDKSDWYGVGNAWDIYQLEIPAQPIKIDSARLPMAKGIIPLAEAKFKSQQWVSAEDAIPIYLRDNVAKKTNSPK